MTQTELVASDISKDLATIGVPQGRLDEVRAFSIELEKASALETLRWASNRYGKRLTFATGFGPEGCVLIDLIGRHGLPIDIFTLDTGLLFPETRTLWKQLEDRYELTIRGIRPVQSVDEQARTHEDKLWESAPDQCCQMRKVVPLSSALEKVDAWITAIRREQSQERANALVVEWDRKFGIAKVNPLVRWTKREIWSHITQHGVPYNPLHDQGFPSIGCQPCTTEVTQGENERAGRWRGFVKTECGLHGPAIPSGRPPRIGS